MKIHTYPTHAEPDAFLIALAKEYGVVTGKPIRFTALAKL
jgi:hypothetical protein